MNKARQKKTAEKKPPLPALCQDALVADSLNAGHYVSDSIYRFNLDIDLHLNLNIGLNRRVVFPVEYI